MRVLAVGNMYPPHHLGGYELVWHAAMRRVRDAGHQGRVLTTGFRTDTRDPDEPDIHRELRWYWDDHRWPAIGWRQRLALERHNRAVVDRHLVHFRPDVVAWWSMGGMSLSLIEQVRRRQIPAVAFVHDDWLCYGPEVDRWTRPFRTHRRLGRLAELISGIPARVELEEAAHYVLVSETVRSHARGAGYVLARSDIAHSGVDLGLFRPQSERSWSWKLLYVGRIDPRKGIEDAVIALAALPAEAKLTMVGGGDPRAELALEAIASRLGLGERVVHRPFVRRADLPELYAGADAVLFPVRWDEPWGLVPLEAMAVGRPVVASGRGGSGEYLRDGVNCLLAAPGDPASLAERVRSLAGDGDLRERLRDGGLQTARTHSEEAFSDRVLAALLEAAGER